jgi:DNA/RNA endonuclease G (NUC1)
MKKFLLFFAVFVSIAVSLQYTTLTEAQNRTPQVSPNIVISQLFGGGGLTNSPYQNDYVELFNRGNAPVSLSNWSVQYASATGSNWLPAFPLPNFDLQPGQYFLLKFDSNGSVGSPLPTPDFVVPVLQPEGFIPNLSSTNGKLALVNISSRLPASTCPTDPSIVDLVGYGSTASCFEGARAATLTATTALLRSGGGCNDTDNNSSDFIVGTPSPRNSSSPFNSCDASTLHASISTNPTTVAPGGNTLLTVTVVPATSPPSTGITATGNLSSIGGSPSQTFFDDGTNGDVTPGDNVFSYLATIPAQTASGNYAVTAVASDAQARTVNLNQNITVNAPLPDEDPLILGNPSGATPDIANENNYLMPKPQYTLSYNRSRSEPNWVAWRLDSSWVGSTPRQDDYRPDPSLPAGWYQVQASDYSGSGYDRGHMCPSGDRTNSVANNSATFLMTNFVPQLPANNQGPWEDFESYCRTLASQGNELYIIDGPHGNIGTVAGGHVVVPDVTWKVVVVLPNGSDDLHRVTKGTRAFGVIVPNHPPVDINAPWRNFRVTVKEVERLTGYNFFNLVPINTQQIIESRHDVQ